MAKAKTNGIDTFTSLCALKGKNEQDYNVSAGITYGDKAAICLKRLKLIAELYNGDKKVNMADTSQRKYSPYVRIVPDAEGSGGFRLSFLDCRCHCAAAGLGARPYFLNPEDVEIAFTKWQAEFEAFAQNEALSLLND